jgi:3-deoxy-D-manno-octulosonic-acid transferase
MMLFSPLLLLHTLKKSHQEPRYRRNLQERFGFSPHIDECIWIHCVSLGETVAAKPLILALQQYLKKTPLLITNTTATGSHAAEKLLRDIDFSCFFPYDLNSAMRRFMHRTHPKIAIIMETELWPNLIHQAHLQNIPILINNGRISPLSLKGYQRLGYLARDMLKKITHINAQTEEDAGRFIALGLPKERCFVTGNIKFDLNIPEDLQEQGDKLKKSWHNRPTWIAASTHDGEENMILAAHQYVLAKQPDALLVLVPRHPNRFDDVYTLCEKFGFSTARYTQAMPTRDQSILLGDTVGKLMLFYAATDITFMGGSLVPIGGHNFIESAALSNPQISGPHLHNFQKVAHQLLEYKALIIADTAETISAAVIELMKNPEKREHLGKQAKEMTLQNKGACAKQLTRILIQINP